MAASGSRRDELVQVAARLFAERGYHGTSMADLAAAMGVQKGSLYSLTGSKQDLLVVITRDGAASFHVALLGHSTRSCGRILPSFLSVSIIFWRIGGPTYKG